MIEEYAKENSKQDLTFAAISYAEINAHNSK